MRPRIVLLSLLVIATVHAFGAEPAFARPHHRPPGAGHARGHRPAHSPGAPAPCYRGLTRWRSSLCTWYGPGFYGNHCANGRILLAPGKANRRLWRRHPGRYVYWGVACFASGAVQVPLGRLVELSYRGHRIVVPCADRGSGGGILQFDLTGATRCWFYGQRAPFDGCQEVHWRIVRRI